MAITKPCKGKCESKYQDETCGKDLRVMNEIKPRTGAGHRCTVCRLVQ